MSAGEFAVALVLSIVGGGIVGVAVDRTWRRRPPVDDPVDDERLEAMHPVRDPWDHR